MAANPPTNRPQRIRLVFYDLDGTLVDSFEDIANALNFALRTLGLPEHSVARVKTFVGRGITRLVELGLGTENLRRLNEALPLVSEYYKSHAAETARVYPGVLETLSQSHGLGISQVVLTNKPQDIAVRTCELAGITPFVDQVRGESPGRPLKPDPQSALEALQELGVAAAESAIVGDGQPDVELGQAAGLYVIGCTWGVSTRDEMKKYGADAVIDAMSEIVPMINSAHRQ